MKSGLRKARLMLCMFFMLCIAGAAAQAATINQDGLSITLTTNRQVYQAGDTIDVSVSIANRNDHPVKLLSVDYLPPAMCVQTQYYDTADLPAIEKNGELNLSSSFAVIKNAEELAPSTGDDARTLLWACTGLVSVFGLFYLNTKKRRELTALLLCAALAGSALSPAAAAAEGDAMAHTAGAVRAKIQSGNAPAEKLPVKEAVVSQEITVMGVQTKMSVSVSYTKPALNNASQTPYAHLLNKPLQETITDQTVVKYDMSADDPDFVPPQSAHNYPSDADLLYFINSGSASISVSLLFGSDCEMEYSFDAILVYDADGNYVDCFTGVSMRNKVLTLQGGAIIRLVSDISVSKYGFTIEEVILHSKPEITGCSVNAAGYVTVKWRKMYGYIGYIVERAPLSASGVIGTYTTLASATSNSAAYTDTGVAMGRGYAYRVRQRYKIDDESFLSGYSEPAQVYCIGQPSLTSGATATVSGSPAVALKWSAAEGATEYRIYRSETEDGPYEQVGAASGTSWTDVLDEKKACYYKVCGAAQYAGRTYTGPMSDAACYGYILPPEKINIRSASTSSIILSWPAVPNADGYAVFRSMTRTGTYTCISKTEKTNGTFAPARSSGMSFYKVRAYTIKNGKYTYSDDSPIAGIYALGVPTGLTAKENSDMTIRITWNEVPNAQLYKVYYSSSQNGTYTECGTTSVKGKTVTTIPVTLSTVYLKVRSMRTDGSVTSCSDLSAPVKVTRAVNPINVRNLYVFEENVPGASPIRTYDGDMELLNTMFEKASPYGRPVTTISYRDLSKAQIISKITSIANLADANDVTTFFLSSHGANGITTGSQAGMLALSDGSWMTFEELAVELKKIPGRVVIILTSCGSGSAIGNGMGGGEGDFDEDMFMNNFIDVICKYDEKLYVEQETEEDEAEMPATGELVVSNKFYVITAARGGENGYYYQDGHTILLEWMNSGVMGADTDSNGTVTLGEMGIYLEDLGNRTQISTADGYDYMHPQIYPDNSTFALFKRR